MSCALCLKDKPLRQSHLIPEFLYAPLYDDKHRFQILSVLPEQGNELKQKGERESLLCDCCEKLFSKYERYASLLFTGQLPTTASREGDLITVKGIEYAKLKLFQLSILWRAGVSTLPLFERVQLGPHAERLRVLLHAENPGRPEDYGCVMSLLTASDGTTPSLIMQPTKVRNQGRVTYRFVIGGMVWVYFVSSVAPPYPFPLCVLRETGSAFIGVGKVSEMQDLGAFVQEVSRLGRAPRGGA